MAHTTTLSPLATAINFLITEKKTSVSALVEVLNCSQDSLYRRLRGETDFLFNESILLCTNLNLSIDALYKLPTGFIQFNTRHLVSTDEHNAVQAVSAYIDKLHADLSIVDKIGIVQLYYAAKDIPIFSFFAHPHLINFKLYFWNLLLFNADEKKTKFDINWLPKPVVDKALELYKSYNLNPSIEIWNFETINSTLHQIVYCANSGLMSVKDAQSILKALLQFVDELEQNCADGRKKNMGTLQLYLNEILLLDNSVIFDLGNTKIFYMPYQTLNFFNTTDKVFVESTIDWMNKQINKSTKISGVGDKDRFRLFTHYRKIIAEHGKIIGK
jgi:hypothetical protein